METNDTIPNSSPSTSSKNSGGERSGRAWAGLLIVAIGGLLLAKKAGAELPSWLFTWPMILITIGFIMGIKHKFRDWGWMIPVAIGLVFLTGEITEGFSAREFFWPVIIIIFGLMMIFRPKRNREHSWRQWQDKRYGSFTDNFENVHTHNTDEDYIDTVTVFGGAKKVIISKNFKGGENTTFFGGVELNLTQADINGRAELELIQVFGGTKLIVPSNWKIQTDELVSVFGGLDDKRKNISSTPDENKVLVLRGTCVFGGIDIKNY